MPLHFPVLCPSLDMHYLNSMSVRKLLMYSVCCWTKPSCYINSWHGRVRSSISSGSRLEFLVPLQPAWSWLSDRRRRLHASMPIVGIGTDLLQLSRLRSLMSRQGAHRLAKRICSESELSKFRLVTTANEQHRFLALRCVLFIILTRLRVGPN